MLNPSQILLMLTQALDMSIQALAKKLGYDRPDTFYKIAKNKAFFQYEALVKLLELYPAISAEFLLGRSDKVFLETDTSSETDTFPDTENPPDYTLTIRILEKEIIRKDKRIAELETRLREKQLSIF
jgi:hypothetical protein